MYPAALLAITLHIPLRSGQPQGREGGLFSLRSVLYLFFEPTSKMSLFSIHSFVCLLDIHSFCISPFGNLRPSFYRSLLACGIVYLHDHCRQLPPLHSLQSFAPYSDLQNNLNNSKPCSSTILLQLPCYWRPVILSLFLAFLQAEKKAQQIYLLESPHTTIILGITPSIILSITVPTTKVITDTMAIMEANLPIP